MVEGEHVFVQGENAYRRDQDKQGGPQTRYAAIVCCCLHVRPETTRGCFVA
jgi:hypothetical protein